jgi:hypothetical protein
MIDNEGTLKYIHNPLMINHRRSKHWDIKYKYVKHLQATGIIAARYVNTKEQLADFLTKPLPPVTFSANIKMLNLTNNV